MNPYNILYTDIIFLAMTKIWPMILYLIMISGMAAGALSRVVSRARCSRYKQKGASWSSEVRWYSLIPNMVNIRAWKYWKILQREVLGGESDHL